MTSLVRFAIEERSLTVNQGTGLKINIAKTKVMRFNAINDEKAMVNGEEVEDVDSFGFGSQSCYLWWSR